MAFLHHTFSNIYTQRDNWLTHIDIRVKLLYLFILLVVNLWTKNVFISLSFLLTSFALLSTLRVSFRSVIKSMVLPASFAILILFVKGFNEGQTDWVSFSLGGHTFVLKTEGLKSGLHISAKIMGGISLVITFAFTTTIHTVTVGLKWYRIPETFLELMSFMCRYIFLLLEEVSAMWIAQKSRLGHVSLTKTVKSLGILGGMLIIRSFERAERTYEAMFVRGYEGGSIFTTRLIPLKKKEYLFMLIIICIAPFLFYAGNREIW